MQHLSETEHIIISHAYPRPLLERAGWISLNGRWSFALDHEAVWTKPDQVKWEKNITVPYSPETPASGVADTGFFRAIWYRREFRNAQVAGA